MYQTIMLVELLMIFTRSIVEAVLLWSITVYLTCLQFYCKTIGEWISIICSQFRYKIINTVSTKAHIIVYKNIYYINILLFVFKVIIS